MHVRQIAISAILIVLICTPGFALAQGGGPSHWLLHDPKGQGPAWRSKDWKGDAGSAMQIEGMMQQMGGMMEYLVDRLQAGSLTSEQIKLMGEMMGHIAEMTNHLASMMSGAVGGPEMPQQMATMLERMTAMQKQMVGLMAAPQSAPLAAPPQDKK
jgi:hypothetical protein